MLQIIFHSEFSHQASSTAGLGGDVTPQNLNGLAVWMIENPLPDSSSDLTSSGASASDTTTPDTDTPQLLEMTTVRAPIVRER